MSEKLSVLIYELKRLSQESRLQSRSGRPDIALTRLSSSLLSLAKSLEDTTEEKSPLTKREGEILAYVSQGFTNREIASALEISEKTIEFHLNSIFNKVHASTRTEAVTNALKNKWLSAT
jgi:DNA-binding NarL/FixJ family response regulator